MKKVVIVREGGWGDLDSKKGSYDTYIAFLKRTIESAEEKDIPTGKMQKVAEVEIIDDLAMVSARLSGSIDTLIFLSRGMLYSARKIKETHPQLKIVVFTGLIPDEEIIIIDKGWSLNPKQIQKVIL